jgi:hypothetical protein
MISKTAGIIQLLMANGYTRISPPPVPKLDTFSDYITVHEVTGKELESLTGISGLSNSLMQINCFSRDYEAAYTLRADIKTLLLGNGGYSGAAGDRTIQGVNHGLDRELYEAKQELHQHITRLSVWWEES